MYAYCQGDPVNYCDPSGRKSVKGENIAIKSDLFDSMFSALRTTNKSLAEFYTLSFAALQGAMSVLSRVNETYDVNSMRIASHTFYPEYGILFGEIYFKGKKNKVYSLSFITGRAENLLDYTLTRYNDAAVGDATFTLMQFFASHTVGLIPVVGDVASMLMDGIGLIENDVFKSFEKRVYKAAINYNNRMDVIIFIPLSLTPV
jgi:hypothetical protein